MVNWKEPIEAHHPDGRVIAVELKYIDKTDPIYPYKIKRALEAPEAWWFPENGIHLSGWVIRNREPEVFTSIDELIEYPALSTMNLSGEEVKVGTADSAQDPYCIWFKTTENAEEVFMSTTEARLLIAALNHAIETVEP